MNSSRIGLPNFVQGSLKCKSKLTNFFYVFVYCQNVLYVLLSKM